MTAPHGRILNRGASILSALVFIALLAGVATTVQYFSPVVAANRMSQTAAEEATKKIEKKCESGEVNKISVQNGKVSQLKDDPIRCWDTKTDPSKPKRLSKTDLCQNFDNPNDCRVAACSSKDGKQSCWVVGKFDSTDPTAKGSFDKVMNATDSKDVAAEMAKQGNVPDRKELGNMDPQTQKSIFDAFAKQKEEQIDQTKKDVDSFKTQLDGIMRACGESPGDLKCPDVVKKAEEDLKKKETELVALEKQMKDLKEAQTAMKAQQCPSGQTGAYPNCKPISSGCTGSNCGSGNSTTGFGGSNPMSALGSLLSGLAKGINTPPATPPAPAQACSTDPNAYAQQQQQYQQQLQQYNYQLQQYQYQQQVAQYQSQLNGGLTPPMMPMPAQPSPCVPSTGSQCRAQPQQPPASACSAGSWRPTYSGACITSWQCISAEGPKAELVCEPDLADVGQTLAITYNCSSGVASSSALKVTTQPGGSATTTIKAPPQGTNTATYTLACTDGGKTTGAQCSVKVNRPNIILVANPRTVSSGGNSLISWLTTGMDTCVISSPDQPDFTQRNSSNTSATGAATTSPIATSSAKFLLHCETLAGGIRDATTTVSITE